MSKFLLIGLFFFLLSCKMDKRVERSTYEEELKSRDFVKVTEAELYDAALVFGNNIAEATQKTLAGNLQKAMQNEGVEGAIRYCNLQAHPLVDSLQSNFKVEIKRTSFKVRNKNNAPDSLESKILEAYQYNHDRELSLEANVQKIGDEMLHFSKPIMINNPLCLSCHGEVGASLSESTHELIGKLYPEDSAVDYKMGDFRAIWSIKIPKKELIKHSFQ